MVAQSRTDQPTPRGAATRSTVAMVGLARAQRADSHQRRKEQRLQNRFVELLPLTHAAADTDADSEAFTDANAHSDRPSHTNADTNAASNSDAYSYANSVAAASSDP